MVSSATTVSSELTNIQNQTTQVNAANNKASVGTGTIDQNSFLQLLMAQLKNQDPTNPTDPSQMLNEESQLTQVQTMQNLNTSLTSSSQLQEASSLIGKTVSVTDPNNAKNTISGTVSGATVNSGISEITMNGTSYALSSIVGIQNASSSSSSSSN